MAQRLPPSVVVTKPAWKPGAQLAAQARRAHAHLLAVEAQPQPGVAGPDRVDRAHQRLQGALKEMHGTNGPNLGRRVTQRTQLYVKQGHNLADATTRAQRDVQQQILRAHRVDAGSLKRQGVDPAAILTRHPGTLEQLAGAIAGFPQGLYTLGSSVYHDVGAVVHGHAPTHTYENVLRPFGHQVEQTFEHPLRDPASSILTGWALGSAGMGGLARVGALRAALRDVPPEVGASVLAKAHVAIRHAIKTPPPTRELGLYSKNAAARVIQRAHDKLTEGQLKQPTRIIATTPGLARAEEAVKYHVSAQARVGRELRAEKAVKDSLESQPALTLERYGATRPARVARALAPGMFDRGHLLFRGPQLSAAEQKAVEIAGTLGDGEHALAAAELHMRAHAGSLERGEGNARGHQAHMALSQLAWQALENPSKHLTAAINASRRAIRERERLLGMTPEESAHRLGARAVELRAQAFGEMSPLAEAHRIQAALEKEGAGAPSPGERGKLEKALAENHRQQGVYAPPPRTFERLVASLKSRPRTIQEAQRRLDALEAKHNAIVGKIAQRFKDEHFPEELRRETLERNTLRGLEKKRGGRRYGRAQEGKQLSRPTSTVSQEFWRKAEDAFQQTVERNPDQPVVKRILAEQDEMHTLQVALDATNELLGGTPHAHPGLGELTKRVPVKGERAGGDFRRLRREESAIKTRLGEVERHEHAQALHGQVVSEGKTLAKQGAFYVPARSTVPTRRVASPGFVSKGLYGVGRPRETLPEMHQAYTGALHRSGSFRSDATGLLADAYRAAQKLASQQRAHRLLLTRFGKNTPEEAGGEFAIPIRDTTAPPKELRDYILKADRGELAHKDYANLPESTARQLADYLMPEEDAAKQALIASGKAKFVDRRIAERLAYYRGPHGRGWNLIDAVNNPLRAGTLYLKPGYSINLLQALGTNVIQQGIFAPQNLYHALTLGKRLAPEDQHAIFALAEQGGRSRALEATAGLGKKTVNAAGEFWNTVIDRYPRVAAILHEARREGFKTPEQLHRLLRTPALEKKLSDIVRRGNYEAVPYGEMTPFERAYLKRVFFFYPWMRAATIYTLKFPVEHPVQAAAYYNLGKVGQQQQAKELGPRPPYLDELVKYAGSSASPVTGNPSTVNTWSTPSDVAQGFAGLFEPGRRGSDEAAKLIQQFGPVAGAIYTLASGKTTLGHDLPSSTSRVAGAAQQIVGSLPPVTFQHRLQAHPSSSNPAKQPIYATGPQAALSGWLGGGLGPRVTNRAALNAKAIAGEVGAFSPERKIAYTAAKDLADLQAGARRLHQAGALPTPQVPRVVRQALGLRRQRDLGYLKEAARLGTKVADLPLHAKARVEVAIVAKTGVLPRDALARMAAQFRAADDATLKRQLPGFWRMYGGGGALATFKHMVTTTPSPSSKGP